MKLCIIITLIGIGMFIGAYFQYKAASIFLGQAIKAEGTVVDHIRKQAKPSSIYSPVVHFMDQKGREFEFTSGVGGGKDRYLKGQKVEILYLPEKPQNVVINDYSSLWGGATFLGGVGCLFLLIAAIFFYAIPR